MKINILDLIDFDKVDTLLEGFNKTTGFVTAILDLNGNVLSKSGWRKICSDFHHINPETSKKCTISDTQLANNMGEGVKYHFYKCLNGLVDVAVPIVINGEHIANLFSGQFFFEEPDRVFFKKQADKYGFNEKKYLEALGKVPVVSKEKVLVTMDFLLNMTQLISETTFQKLEQIELNATIRESEEKFKSVFETANVGKSITLITGEIDVNETFCKMLGYTREELQNKKWQDITPEDDIPIVEKILEPMLNGEENSARFEKRYICKNGTHLWADVSVSIRRDKNNKPLYFITTVIDITERRQAEVALHRNEELYRSLFENMLNGFAYCKMLFEDGKPIDYIYLAVNNAFVAQTGLKDVVGRKVTEIIPGIREADPQLFEVLGRVSLTGQPVQFEIFLEALQNWFMLSLYSPAHEHFVAVFDVITERKNVELALQKSEERYRTIISNIPGGLIHIFDRDMKYVFNAGEELVRLGLSNEFLVGKSIYEVLPTETASRVEAQYNRVLAGETVRFEGAYGEDYFRLTSAPLRNTDGEIENILTLSVNITERKQAKQVLRESEEKLRLFVEQAPAPIAMLDEKLNFLAASNRWLSGHGWKERNLIGRNMYEEFPDVPERWKEIHRRCLSGATESNEADPWVRSDGGTNWIRWEMGPWRKSDGSIGGLVVFSVDITENKLSEEALEISKERLLLAAEGANLGIWNWNIMTGELIWSDQCRALFGIGLAESMSFQRFIEALHPDDRERTNLAVKDALDNHKDFDIEYRSVWSDESTHWLAARGRGYYDTTGRAIRMEGVVLDITERREAEMELRLSEELFSNAFHVGPTGMTITRIADGKFIDANESFCKLFEFDRDEVIGYTSTELNLWTHEERNKLMQKQIASGGLHNFELLAQSKSGRIINILFSSKQVEIRGDACHITTVIDITEHKSAEEALRNSEARFRNAFENIPDVIVIYDNNLKIRHINDATLRITGRPVSDFLGKRDDEIWPREVYQAYLPTLDKALKSGEICSVETKLVLSDIGTQYLRITCVPILDESGNVNEVMGITHDFTQRKQAEESNKAERDFSNALLDGLPGIFYFYDSDFKFLRWNKNFETVSGYSATEIATMGPLDFYSDSEKDLLKERIAEVFTKGYSEVEADFLSKDGTRTPYFFNGFKFNYNNKDCLIGIGIDITDRKRAELEIAQLNLELENRVTERTFQLETANKELESFSYSISHDLRAPLRAIYGFSQILAGRHRESLDNEGKKYMDYIVESSIRMEQLINDLLNYSRLGRKTVEIRPVSFKKIFEAIFDDFKSQIDEIGGKLRVPDNPPVIPAEESLLRQIFSNLIGNAIKYRHTDAALLINISFETIQDGVLIKVADNGIGIPVEHHEKIFNVFQRLHGEDKYPGTGIGLANVKKAVSLLGGTIYVESTVGKGSTFILKFTKQKLKNDEQTSSNTFS